MEGFARSIVATTCSIVIVRCSENRSVPVMSMLTWDGIYFEYSNYCISEHADVSTCHYRHRYAQLTAIAGIQTKQSTTLCTTHSKNTFGRKQKTFPFKTISTQHDTVQVFPPDAVLRFRLLLKLDLTQLFHPLGLRAYTINNI